MLRRLACLTEAESHPQSLTGGCLTQITASSSNKQAPVLAKNPGKAPLHCRLGALELMPCDAARIRIQGAAVAVPLSIVDAQRVVSGPLCLIWLRQDVEGAHHKSRL